MRASELLITLPLGESRTYVDVLRDCGPARRPEYNRGEGQTESEIIGLTQSPLPISRS
jgi:hypothetical protein